MFIYDSNDQATLKGTEEYFEMVASQEEIYIEEREEQVRMILESNDPPHRSRSEIYDPQRDDAGEEVITGDADALLLADRSRDKL